MNEENTIQLTVTININGNAEETGKAIGEMIKQLTPENAEALGRSMLERIGYEVIERRSKQSPDESP